MGLSSENGAHRIAVEWTEKGETKQGVYIPRRDTSSMFNTFAGGRIFPGRHFNARFDVKEVDGNYQVAFKSADGAFISIDANKTKKFSPDSIFQNFDNASRFFEGGGVGYSPNRSRYDGLQLKTFKWEMEPLQVTSVRSSFFEDEKVFPPVTVKFDNALLMTQINHEWHSVGSQPR